MRRDAEGIDDALRVLPFIETAGLHDQRNVVAETNIAGIRLRLDGDNLSIMLTDYDAPKFDMTTDAPDPGIDDPLEKRTPGGLGLLLVKKMMDRIEYRHENGIGTVLLSKCVG